MDKILSSTTTVIPTQNIQFQEIIGRGNTGVVYRGLYNTNPIIIKCISSGNYQEIDNFYKDVFQEITIYNKVTNCRRLSSYYGISHNFSKENSNNEVTIYLLLHQYNHQGDLYDYIYRDNFWIQGIYTMDPSQKIELIYQLCKSIEELHSYNIVHCDIKLNNALYHNNDRIILFDFGGSIDLDNKKIIKVSEIVGTIGYMCPENNQGIISKKTDIYSLGVCMLEIWKGKIWNHGNTYKECRKEVLAALRSIKNTVLHKIIKSCIDTTLEHRPYIHTLLRKIILVKNNLQNTV